MEAIGGARTLWRSFGSRRARRTREALAAALVSSVRSSKFGAGAFGVRRPLRFLTDKLHMNEKQVAELARILSELKTDHVQLELDRRRARSAFADAMDCQAFDAALAGEGGARCVATAKRSHDAAIKALQHMHALLDPEQRSRLADLIRTGTLLL